MLLEIAVDALRESPTNPRRTFADVEELAASIRARGLLQPLLVRPVGSDYEIVCGHRRARAATKAGLRMLPCVVRDLDDRQALEAQLVENSQRAEVAPLEEADALARLRTEHRVSIPQLAARLGRSESYVYARLCLAQLCDEGREALQAGRLLPSVALLVARLPDHLQAEAVAQIAPRDDEDDGAPEPCSLGNARRHFERHFLLRLAEAPFPVADHKLVEAAGACPSCPKRTGRQGALFGDLAEEDCCTDWKCWEAKCAAFDARRIAEARESGLPVLEAQLAAEALSYSGSHVDLDAKCWRDSERRTWRELAGDAIVAEALAVYDGTVHEVARKEVVLEALAEAGVEWAVQEREADAGREERIKERERERKQEEAEEKRNAEVRSRLIQAAAESARTVYEADVLRAVLLWMVNFGVGVVVREAVEQALGVTDLPALMRDGATRPRELVAALLVARYHLASESLEDPQIAEICDALQLDLKAITAEPKRKAAKAKAPKSRKEAAP